MKINLSNISVEKLFYLFENKLSILSSKFQIEFLLEDVEMIFYKKTDDVYVFSIEKTLFDNCDAHSIFLDSGYTSNNLSLGRYPVVMSFFNNKQYVDFYISLTNNTMENLVYLIYFVMNCLNNKVML